MSIVTDDGENSKGVLIRVSETRKYQQYMELVKGQEYKVNNTGDENELLLTPNYRIILPSWIRRILDVAEISPESPKPTDGYYYSYILRNGRRKVAPGQLLLN